MSLNISTNTAALRAGSYLSHNNALLQRSLDRLASGKKISSPIDDPGSLAVSMKLSASINRLAGAQNNSQNALSFLEVQDGMLDSVGKIIDRMSELKGLASQDPMKGEQDRASYNNEFKNTTAVDGAEGEVYFNAAKQADWADNTMSIFTSAQGSSGAKVSIHKATLLSALTLRMDRTLAGGALNGVAQSGVSKKWSEAAVQQRLNATTAQYTSTIDGTVTGIKANNENAWITLATPSIGGTLELDQLSVGVITQALENISYLRSQNGGTQSRLAFNIESLSQQKTNMRSALGRVVDVDIAEESTNLAKYSILNQAAASMLAQANASVDVALMLLR